MNLIKRTSAGVLICLLLYGCGFFVAAAKKVSEYCPGLNLKLNGVSIITNNGRKMTIVAYEDSYQKKVDAYVSDKANGFAADNPRKYLDLKDDDNSVVADGDSILTKSVEGGGRNGTVIYNATTRKIIIVEPKYQ